MTSYRSEALYVKRTGDIDISMFFKDFMESDFVSRFDRPLEGEKIVNNVG
ncbi:hypothetical protein [Nitratireductor rhodophyticola]